MDAGERSRDKVLSFITLSFLARHFAGRFLQEFGEVSQDEGAFPLTSLEIVDAGEFQMGKPRRYMQAAFPLPTLPGARQESDRSCGPGF
jgi:hypothetical protein